MLNASVDFEIFGSKHNLTSCRISVEIYVRRPQSFLYLYFQMKDIYGFG